MPIFSGKIELKELALLLMCCSAFGLTIIPSIATAILGVLAKGDIARSGGALSGHGQAVTGLVTGIIAVVLSLAVIVFFVVIIVADGSTNFGY